MNNKVLGTAWERTVCAILSERGYWAHFITPDSRGAQPFDIIAVKNGIGYAVECKTLSEDKKSFNISRLEDNQEMAFAKWLSCENAMPEVWIEHGDEIYRCPYDVLEKKGTVKLKDMRRDKDAERIRMRLQGRIQES